MAFNLRELVAELECQGKPQHSESLVAALGEDGLPYSVKSVEYDEEADTVWLRIEET